MKDFKRSGSSFGNRGGSSFGGNRGGGSRGGSSFGGNRGGGSRDGDREMFQTTCSECNKRCEVPFRPTGEKPVYCNDCFGSKREGTFERNDRPERSFKKDNDFSPRSNNTGGNNEDLKRSIEMLNTKLDSLIRMIGSAPKPTAVESKKESLKSMVEKIENPVVKSAPAKKVSKPVVKKSAPKKAAPVKKAVKSVTKKK
jgi:CxxC-x17-CxxC domain-containing protein